MNKDFNKTLMQYFEWYIKPEENLWNKCKTEAQYLSSIGITSIWLPPAYKGSGGIYDTGYGVYDLYDLGEFDQKNTIRTKYGTKEEFIEAVKTLKGNNIQVICDIVFNHKMGADELETVIATEYNPMNRNEEITENPIEIEAWTKFNFPNRNNMYSDFKWDWTHFHAVDFDNRTQKNGIFKFYGKRWDESVDKENGNFDYLMGCDVDLNNVEVVKELINWTKWFLNEANFDGFRIDAAKHIQCGFFKTWIKTLRTDTSKKLPTVAEYWSNNINALLNYIKETDGMIDLFDVPLHFNFLNASYSNGQFDMRTIFDNTLVKEDPQRAITFVDNHDTEPGQGLESWIADWFKPLAYSLILLRKDGLPCIFYGDYYGVKERNISSKKEILENLIRTRKYFAYGHQIDYFDHPNLVGWVLEGDVEHTDSGLVVVMTDKEGGYKQMNAGKNLANQILYDITGNRKDTVYVDENGIGNFPCNDGSVSVWIKKDNMYRDIVDTTI